MLETMRRHGRAAVAAVIRFNRDDGWAIASHITLSGIMALFPFLIFCTSLAAFFDLGEFPPMAFDLMFELWPPAVAEPLSWELLNVLTQPRGDVLTFGAVLALFFASSGVEALRLGLNRAYRTRETRGILRLRAQSILFVLLASIVLAAAGFLLVVVPLAEAAAARFAPWLDDYLIDLGDWRLAASVAILVFGLFASHRWLPCEHAGYRALAPGVALTLVLWAVASLGFAAYLRTFANYGATYAGLAGIVVAVLFVYLMSAIYLIGAEYNAALMAFDKNEGK
ncbi:MAG: hypothetical protein BroJett030_13670 [Alphaproteobacteria bacterium]|nr:MAG: hypothetical protein BroJett030_13670 [Alphaproteobacteria bacterium]